MPCVVYWTLSSTRGDVPSLPQVAWLPCRNTSSGWALPVNVLGRVTDAQISVARSPRTSGSTAGSKRYSEVVVASGPNPVGSGAASSSSELADAFPRSSRPEEQPVIGTPATIRTMGRTPKPRRRRARVCMGEA